MNKKTLPVKSRVKRLIFFYWTLLVIPETTQKIIETRSHDTAIKTNPIPAFFKIFNPSPNFLSSPAAVTILNPPQSKSTKAIKPSIPRTQLIALFTTVRNQSFAWPCFTPATHPISLTLLLSYFNPSALNACVLDPSPALTKAKLEEAISPSPIIKVAIFLIIFLW